MANVHLDARRAAHAVRGGAHVAASHSDVEGYEAINARMRKAYA